VVLAFHSVVQYHNTGYTESKGCFFKFSNCFILNHGISVSTDNCSGLDVEFFFIWLIIWSIKCLHLHETWSLWRVDNSPLLDCILSQTDPIHAIKLKINKEWSAPNIVSVFKWISNTLKVLKFGAREGSRSLVWPNVWKMKKVLQRMKEKSKWIGHILRETRDWRKWIRNGKTGKKTSSATGYA